MTSFPKVPFTNEEATGVINSVVIGTNTAPRKPHSCFFISCFNVSVTPSTNILEFSSDFMILIISSIPSFQMSTVNPFPALTAPHQLIFLSKLSIIDEVALDSNLAKYLQSKEDQNSIFFCLNYLSHYLPLYLAYYQDIYLIELFRQLSFTEFYNSRHIISESISYFSFFLAVKNNSCGNSSS